MISDILRVSHCSFLRSCCRINSNLGERQDKQPCVFAIGQTKNRFNTFYIVVETHPLQNHQLIGCFDELLKSNCIVNLSYNVSLVLFYTLVQIYNIYLTTTDKSPLVCEFQANLFSRKTKQNVKMFILSVGALNA